MKTTPWSFFSILVGSLEKEWIPLFFREYFPIDTVVEGCIIPFFTQTSLFSLLESVF